METLCTQFFAHISVDIMLQYAFAGDTKFVAQDPCRVSNVRGRYQRQEGDISNRRAIPPVQRFENRKMR